MFETQKIDSFFSGEKNLLDDDEDIFISRRVRVVRFLRLFLPSLTALLLGLGVILFDFETNNDSMLPITEGDEVYFEKFRMKNTVFEITDTDNQLSTLKADLIEEIETGKKTYNLVKPNAKTLDKDNVITLVAENGIYNQNTHVLNLKTNVVANYNSQMEIKTNSATYDFAKDSGYGNEKVIGDGERGHFVANKFTFDKRKGVIKLIDNVFMKSDKMEITSPISVTMYTNENKVIAPKAIIKKDGSTLKGDEVTALFKDMKRFEIKHAISKGNTEIHSGNKKSFAEKAEYDAKSGLIKLFNNVKIIDTAGYTAIGDNGVYDSLKKVFTLTSNVKIVDKEGYTATAEKGIYNDLKKTFTLINNVKVIDKSGYTATAENGIYDLNKKTFTLNKNVIIKKDNNIVTSPKAIYFQNKDEFRFYDGVKIQQEENSASANNGVFFIKKNIAELEGNVIITKGKNLVMGDKAISDFNTSKSRLIAKKHRRISGKLFENTLKD